MKFGKKLIEQASPQWADAYLPYKSLKETIKLFQGAGPATNKAEGEFLAALLNGIQTVNTFFTGQEAEYARRLESLARTLAAPKNWLLQAPIFDDDDADPDFPSVVSMLVGGVHVPEEQRRVPDVMQRGRPPPQVQRMRPPPRPTRLHPTPNRPCSH